MRSGRHHGKQFAVHRRLIDKIQFIMPDRLNRMINLPVPDESDIRGADASFPKSAVDQRLDGSQLRPECETEMRCLNPTVSVQIKMIRHPADLPYPRCPVHNTRQVFQTKHPFFHVLHPFPGFRSLARLLNDLAKISIE